MIKFSIILPCYNESENIVEILERFGSIINNFDTELIVVNNGSEDDTAFILENNICKYKFARTVDIPVNIGYGFGIMNGLREAQGNWVGWSHADLQTDPADVVKAINICRNYTEYLFVKGERSGRSTFARLFSKSMEVFVRIILNKKLTEINAQPNFFNAKLLDFTNCPPNHWGLDLYFYYIAQKADFSFERIPVLFPDRKAGVSKWNSGFFSRIKFSVKMLMYCFEMKKNENNKS